MRVFARRRGRHGRRLRRQRDDEAVDHRHLVLAGAPTFGDVLRVVRQPLDALRVARPEDRDVVAVLEAEVLDTFRSGRELQRLVVDLLLDVEGGVAQVLEEVRLLVARPAVALVRILSQRGSSNPYKTRERYSA